MKLLLILWVFATMFSVYAAKDSTFSSDTMPDHIAIQNTVWIADYSLSPTDAQIRNDLRMLQQGKTTLGNTQHYEKHIPQMVPIGKDWNDRDLIHEIIPTRYIPPQKIWDPKLKVHKIFPPMPAKGCDSVYCGFKTQIHFPPKTNQAHIFLNYTYISRVDSHRYDIWDSEADVMCSFLSKYAVVGTFKRTLHHKLDVDQSYIYVVEQTLSTQTKAVVPSAINWLCDETTWIGRCFANEENYSVQRCRVWILHIYPVRLSLKN